MSFNTCEKKASSVEEEDAEGLGSQLGRSFKCCKCSEAFFLVKTLIWHEIIVHNSSKSIRLIESNNALVSEMSEGSSLQGDKVDDDAWHEDDHVEEESDEDSSENTNLNLVYIKEENIDDELGHDWPGTPEENLGLFVDNEGPSDIKMECADIKEEPFESC